MTSRDKTELRQIADRLAKALHQQKSKAFKIEREDLQRLLNLIDLVDVTSDDDWDDDDDEMDSEIGFLKDEVEKLKKQVEGLGVI